MTRDRRRKLAVRSRMAADGVPYTEASTRTTPRTAAVCLRIGLDGGTRRPITWSSPAEGPAHLWLAGDHHPDPAELAAQATAGGATCWRWNPEIGVEGHPTLQGHHLVEMLRQAADRPTDRTNSPLYLILDRLTSFFEAASPADADSAAQSLIYLTRTGRTTDTHLVLLLPEPTNFSSDLFWTLHGNSGWIDMARLVHPALEKLLLAEPCWEIQVGPQRNDVLDRHFATEAEALGWIVDFAARHRAEEGHRDWKVVPSGRPCAVVACTGCGAQAENDTGGPLHVLTKTQYDEAVRSALFERRPGTDLLYCHDCIRDPEVDTTGLLPAWVNYPASPPDLSQGLPFATGADGSAVYWSPVETSSMLVVGGPGGGKTTLVQALVYGARRAQWEVHVFDQNNVHLYVPLRLASLVRLQPKAVRSLGTAAGVVRSLISEMNSRLQVLEDFGATTYQQLSTAMMHPLLLVVDSAGPWLTSEDDEHDRMRTDLAALATKGPACGMHLILVDDAVDGPATGLLTGPDCPPPCQVTLGQPGSAGGREVPAGRALWEAPGASPQWVQIWYGSAAGYESLLAEKFLSKK